MDHTRIEAAADRVLEKTIAKLGIDLERYSVRPMGPGYSVPMTDVDGTIYHAWGKIIGDVFRFMVLEGDGNIDRRERLVGFERVLASKMFVLAT